MPIDRGDDDAPDVDGGEDDEDIIREAHKRFIKCEKWEAIARRRWQEDWQFANGDSENNFQWPDQLYVARTTNERPALTINKVRQHNLQIINDAKQNKTGIKYRPIGDGATAESADVLEGIVRHIQDVSKANNGRGTAIEFQVTCGLGWTRVVTDYESSDTFDQEIYIRPVDDPLSVFLDPDTCEKDGSDARFGFVFQDRPRDEVRDEYPDLDLPVSNAVDGHDAGWLRDDHVRIAEYYRVKEDKDELIGTPEGVAKLKSLLDPEFIKILEEQAKAQGQELQRRPVMRKRLEWFKIVGDKIVERQKPPGKTVPLVPWIGAQVVIQGQMDRYGHTRHLKDPQRMLNYNRSAAVEFGALQSKTPYTAPVRAIEGLETYWETANRENHSVLPYNDIDDNGQPIEKPERQQPPTSAPVFIEGAQAAERDMMIASGQYEAELGAPSNEVSGKAINERQRQGDRATYHFIDNQAIAIRREGQIILELIPEIYDTPRVKRILGEDGEESQVHIDPGAPQAQMAMQRGDQITRVLNPRIGRYEVVSDVGPDYATQRQEAFNAIVQVITQAPQLLGVIGDLLFKVADFPLADEIAERLKPGLQPEAQQAIQQLQVQLAKANHTLGETMQALTEERLKNKAGDAKNAVAAFDADTRRLAVFGQSAPMMDPEAWTAAIREAVRQAMQDNLGPVSLRLKDNVTVDTSPNGPPGATGQLPVHVPNVGQQAARPGGASPNVLVPSQGGVA